MRGSSFLLVLSACGRVAFAPLADATPGSGSGDASDAAATIDAPDLTSGLHYEFHLDEALTMHDVAESAAGQNGYALNLADVTAVAGKVGGAFHFDGVQYQSYVIFPATNTGGCAAVPALTGSLTVAAWASFDSLHPWYGYSLGDFALSQGSTGGTGGAWGLGATDGCGAETIGFEVAFSDTARFTRCGRTLLAPGAWHFLVGVYDATAKTVTVYLDGVEDNGSATANSSAIGSSLNPGPMCPYLASTGNQQALLIGSLDEVRIYDRALTAADVAALYVASGG